MTEINQKEYLKKYLGIGKEDGKKKKRKKKPKSIIGAGLTIVDDDLDISQATTVEEAVTILNINEDAPQIVGVIDERPLALRVDDYRKSDRWKAIGEDNDSIVETQNVEKDNSPPRRKVESAVDTKRNDSDNSPPRRNRSASPVDIRKCRGSDNSPPRRKIRKDSRSPNNRNRYDSDNSPARKRNTSKSPERSRKRRDSDNSPPRKRNKSPENAQRKHYDSDNSPPRKYKANSPKTRYDSDNSPPRRNARRSPEGNTSRNRYEKQTNKEYSRKRSPPVRERGWGFKNNQREDERETESKSTRDANVYKRAKESESPKRKRHDSDNSPPRKSSNTTPKEDKTTKKMTKTLDGKIAGLQNAKDLDAETALLKKREEEHFKNLSAEVSGVNAATIIRDRKTGKIRDLRKEAEDKREKDKRAAVHKEKYTRWGKGLKQVEDREEKLAQDAYEMTKPLARYVDDLDLEQHLKDQEREGDPMLAYIRSKKKKDIVASGKPTKPQYDGEFMPNRYGIPPGHRWDGVDRSSGYEKRWFETQNAKKAQEEDTYKWSTEDM